MKSLTEIEAYITERKEATNTKKAEAVFAREAGQNILERLDANGVDNECDGYQEIVKAICSIDEDIENYKSIINGYDKILEALERLEYRES